MQSFKGLLSSMIFHKAGQSECFALPAKGQPDYHISGWLISKDVTIPIEDQW